MPRRARHSFHSGNSSTCIPTAPDFDLPAVDSSVAKVTNNNALLAAGGCHSWSATTKLLSIPNSCTLTLGASGVTHDFYVCELSLTHSSQLYVTARREREHLVRPARRVRGQHRSRTRRLGIEDPHQRRHPGVDRSRSWSATRPRRRSWTSPPAGPATGPRATTTSSSTRRRRWSPPTPAPTSAAGSPGSRSSVERGASLTKNSGASGVGAARDRRAPRCRTMSRRVPRVHADERLVDAPTPAASHVRATSRPPAIGSEVDGFTHGRAAGGDRRRADRDRGTRDADDVGLCKRSRRTTTGPRRSRTRG